MQFTVKQTTTLMEFLAKSLAGKSRTGIKALLAKRLVFVDQKVETQFNLALVPGQIIAIGKKTAAEPVMLRGVRIVYDDDDLVVVEKEAGLLSVAADTGSEKSAHSITGAHLKRLNHKARLFIVHRLDRETSGLMMFVKHKELQRKLRENWQESILMRSYAVVVEGVVAKDTGKIVSWLKGTDELRTYSSPVEGDGQKAISHFKVVRRAAANTLLDVELETGRKNQIRVHMQDMGHPVVGDDKYGATTNPIKRLGLHAQMLKFSHPVSGQAMAFESETPKEFLRLFTVTTRQN